MTTSSNLLPLSGIEQSQLEAIMQKAGEEILAFRAGKDGRKVEVKTKPDGTSVTNADLASNEILVRELNALFPEHGIFSEELPPDPANLEKEYCWLIDPIDGTRSFIEGRDDFSILLALSHRQKIVFGIMYFPAKKMWGIAGKGRGAMLNGTPLRVSKESSARAHSVYLRNISPSKTDSMYLQTMDSGMAFFELCKGNFDGLAINLSSTFGEWDVAAPMLMVEEAGGKVTDEKGQELVFGLGKPKFKYIVASNGLTHEEILALTKG